MTARPASGSGCRREHRLDRRDDLQRLGHAAGAGLAALGHLARVRADEAHAVGSQRRRGCAASPGAPTCARSSPAPSAPACRWRAARPWRGRRPARPPAWPSGRRSPARPRRVGLAREPDVADIVLVLAVEQVGVDLSAGERADRQRRDEFCAACVSTARTARRARAAGGSGRAPCRRRCRRR